MMKQLAFFALTLALVAPVAGGAQTLAQNANTRQAILELEYQLMDPGVTPARATQIEAQVTQLETKANGNELDTLPVPAYGSCDADTSTIAYLQNELSTADLDYQQTVIDQRAIYDLGVNLKQRGC